MSDANNNIKLSFRFGGRELKTDGTGRITIRMPKSRYTPVQTQGVAIHAPRTTNELLHLAHLLRKTYYFDAATQHIGFDYTLDFPLARGRGFPYILGYDPIERGYGLPLVLDYDILI